MAGYTELFIIVDIYLLWPAPDRIVDLLITLGVDPEYCNTAGKTRFYYYNNDTDISIITIV